MNLHIILFQGSQQPHFQYCLTVLNNIHYVQNNNNKTRPPSSLFSRPLSMCIRTEGGGGRMFHSNTAEIF